MCFVFACNHRSGANSCKFYRFPTDGKKRLLWGKLCRRADRQPGDQNDRICSCHFKDGVKEGDPAYFAWNEGKAMDFSDPECTKRRKKIRSEESLSSSQMDQLQITHVTECQDQEELISDHNYSASCTFNCTQEMQRLSTEIEHLEKELHALRLESSKRRPMSIHDIKDSEEKVHELIPIMVSYFLTISVKLVAKCH
ncbi:uncharacterized protein LOC133200517 [Saccostrea echinata]|uniref:uncharacterized protein LOC133200517 n=1 Tax=Saccostrea echinata TaxID=191078 RepID=UPI002A7F3E5E|nr:uncharacterized protein LOC133200517 [Saccostrea echinata]